MLSDSSASYGSGKSIFTLRDCLDFGIKNFFKNRPLSDAANIALVSDFSKLESKLNLCFFEDETTAKSVIDLLAMLSEESRANFLEYSRNVLLLLDLSNNDFDDLTERLRNGLFLGSEKGLQQRDEMLAIIRTDPIYICLIGLALFSPFTSLFRNEVKNG